MTATPITPIIWRKSTRSGSHQYSNCVQCAITTVAAVLAPVTNTHPPATRPISTTPTDS